MGNAIMLTSGGVATLPDNFTGFSSGTFTPETDVHDYTIYHGLGKIPDLVIIQPISGTPTANATNGILIAGRELFGVTGCQWYSYGANTFAATARNSERNIYEGITGQGLTYVDDEKFIVCTHHGVNYYWCKDVTYRWMAFTQDLEEEK